EPAHEIAVRFAAVHQIDGETLFAERDAGCQPLTGAAAPVLVGERTEADDAGAPHLWFFLRDRAHEIDDLLTVLTAEGIGNRIDEPAHAGARLFGLELGHES